MIGSSETVSASNATITSVNTTLNQVVVSNLGSFTANPLLEYSIRKLEKSRSNVGLVLGNNKYFANIQNLYCDDYSTFGYVTSLSLPEYEIEDSLIESQLPNGLESNFDGYNSFNKTYSILKFHLHFIH